MTRSSSSLYEVRSSQGSTALSRKRQWCGLQQVLSLKCCLIFSWFIFTFSTVGFLLLMAARLVLEGNWDKLVYLVTGVCFVNLIWCASWFRWHFERRWGYIEAIAARAGRILPTPFILCSLLYLSCLFT